MAATEQDERESIIRVLRTITPTLPIGRIWGRHKDATPEQAAEGNAWAADPEDIADLIVAALAQTRSE